MRVALLTLFVLSVATPHLTSSAAEPRVERNVFYTEAKTERQSLDVYAPAAADPMKKYPIVVWVHGGGWTRGDKSSVQKKPAYFVEQGFVFVSTNYRFLPNVTLQEMTGDIALAIKWAHDNAPKYGGDPQSIFVMGHSAGAHLAALVCTDDRHVKKAGLTLAVIKGCVPVDVSAYDIPKRVKDGGAVPTDALKKIFGETELAQREVSPAAHVTAGKSIPSFLILHVADRADTRTQSQWFADRLRAAEVKATVVAAEGKNHGSINSDLGTPGDKPTAALADFLASCLKK